MAAGTTPAAKVKDRTGPLVRAACGSNPAAPVID